MIDTFKGFSISVENRWKNNTTKVKSFVIVCAPWRDGEYTHHINIFETIPDSIRRMIVRDAILTTPSGLLQSGGEKCHK